MLNLNVFTELKYSTFSWGNRQNSIWVMELNLKILKIEGLNLEKKTFVSNFV